MLFTLLLAGNHTDLGAAAPLPIGYGALGYDAPVPGTYALPPLFGAADGPVLADDGTTTRLHQIFGDRVVVLSFVYSTCSDVAGCPLATAVLHRLQQRLQEAPAIADRVRLVTFSFDASHDTPEAMRQYGEGLRGKAPDWRFLSAASAATLQPILAAYDQTVRIDYDAQGRALDTFSHLLRVYLIDPDKRVRNIYSASFLHPDLLVADIRTLLLEGGDAASPATASSQAGGDRTITLERTR
jgi:cytochrome c peroxidase